MTTQEKVYLDAQAACGLKAGDYVRVTREAKVREAGWGNPWVLDMNAAVGRIGKVNCLCNFGVRVHFGSPIINTWNFPYFVLEKVEEPEHEFKPFDKVLVRDGDDEKWKPQIFSCYVKDGIHIYYTLAEDSYAQCIPYEGNEHLAGTTDKPDE